MELVGSKAPPLMFHMSSLIIMDNNKRLIITGRP